MIRAKYVLSAAEGTQSTPYNLFYAPTVVKSLLLFDRGVVALLNRRRFKNLS